MKTMIRLSGAFVVVMIAVAALAGTPQQETGLTAPNDALTIPRSLAITDGGTQVCNVDLYSTSQAPGNPPRNPNQFNIPMSTGSVPAITIQSPDAGAWAYTDVLAVTPGLGVLIPTGGGWTTACKRQLRPLQFDGGVYTGCVVCISAPAGGTAAQVIVHGVAGTFP